ncbi:MAG TPA: hypothetical protein VH138_18535 [Vicinamibacterales bacterium]|nr:hypothetical protein [Vicinamibacterales bacterium]
MPSLQPPQSRVTDAAGWFLNRRGTALGVVVGAVGLGSSFSMRLVPPMTAGAGCGARSCSWRPAQCSALWR